MRNLHAIIGVMLLSACGGSDSSSASNNPAIPTTTDTSPPSMQPLLEVHNQERALVGAVPLIWSEQLANYAQTWSDHLANTNCQLRHRTAAENTLSTGENLAWYSSYGGALQAINSARPAQSWAAEKANYTHLTNTCAPNKACGHYTQIVWNTTLNVGCARSICADNSQIWVCNYNPPGNYIGVKPY